MEIVSISNHLVKYEVSYLNKNSSLLGVTPL